MRYQSNIKGAVEFRKHDVMKSKSLNTLKHKFRKITSLRQLQRWKEQLWK